MKILVTGAAGFIGFHVVRRLITEGHRVFGIDNMNEYYDVSLKESRLDILSAQKGFDFTKMDIADANAVDRLFNDSKFTHVIHLAAQAGVRYSIENPGAYTSANLVGFMNILEACRRIKPEHFIFASSSSVYGLNVIMPYSVHHNVDHPISLYAATKKSNELLVHCYAHLYGIPSTGLRFFTVYGPWGRPDMAYFKFADAIMKGETIDVYNNGEMERDFSYIDDIVSGIIGLMDHPPAANPDWDRTTSDPGSSSAPYRIYNIGNNGPEKLTNFIEVLEKHLGKRADIRFMPIQPGDVRATYADIEDLSRDTGFHPETTIDEGLGKFVKWFKDYYGY
jgi:UDP-glucuronate 4-epimerase